MNYTHSLPPQEGAVSYMKLSHELIQSRFQSVSARIFNKRLFWRALQRSYGFQGNTHGHCDVSRTVHEYDSFGRWCCEMRYSYKRIQYNQKPRRAKLSDEQIQRLLNDAGFVRWCSRASRGRQSSHRRTSIHPSIVRTQWSGFRKGDEWRDSIVFLATSECIR